MNKKVKPMIEYQIRYVLYAKSQGRSPEEQMEHDYQEFPGGQMLGFILWIKNKWNIFKKRNKILDSHAISDKEHAEFDKWLEENLWP